MKLTALLAAATAALALAPAANAAVYQYDITPIAGTDGRYTISFQLESTATPSFTVAGMVRYFPLSVAIAGPGIPAGTVVNTGVNLGLQFNADGSFSGTQGYLTVTYISGLGGGFTRFDVYNSYVLGGSNAAPIFRTGDFLMSTTPRNNAPTRPADNYLVRVTQPGAVPEPATWAMLIAGFGAAGVAMRRRTAVRFAF